MAAPTKKHIGLLFCLGMIISACLGIGLVKSVSAIENVDESLKKIQAIIKIMVTIQNEYVEPSKTNTEDMVNGAIHGMVETLDKYSVFMERDEAKEFNDQTQGSFGGLGIQIDLIDGWLTVIEPLPNTPAAKVGLMSGDRIVEIDGESTKGIKIHQAIKKLKGEPDTDVTLSIARRGEKQLLEKTITRAIISTQAVQEDEIKMLDNTIGYIRLRDFTRDAAEETEKGIRSLQEQGMKALVFDLRDNVGGLLDVAVSICDLFIEKNGVIVSYRGRNDREKIYKAQRAPLGMFPLAILVNEFSASASEIVAGCIQDHRRGIIVGPIGQKTFGKGSVQTLIELDNVMEGAFLKLTTAKYYTPSGRSISDDKGLAPDIAAQITSEQRLEIRRAGKSGQLLPEHVGKKPEQEPDEFVTEKPHDENHQITVEEAFTPIANPEKENDTIYDIELFTAYQCLKSIEVIRTGSEEHFSLANPRN
jgi:carboxyl-terminal processing protease